MGFVGQDRGQDARFMVLEPRVLFDGAAGEFAERAMLHHADHASHQDHHADALIDSLRAAPSQQAIIFVDDKVENIGTLLADVGPGAEIHILNSSRDGVAQMAEALQGRHDISAIHIISHGAAGELQLGSSQLTLSSMKGSHAHDLAVIGAALSTDADILVYGCDFAEGQKGADAVAALATATRADIAASTNISGAAALGGDWTLEAHAGDITTGSLHAWHWFSTLAKSVINPGGGLNADSSDGMAIHVIDNGQLQIVYNLNGTAAGNYQLYYPGTNTESPTLFNGVYLAIGNKVTGSSHYADGTARNANWGKLGQTMSGTGTTLDPYIVTTTLFSATDGNTVYNAATDAKVVIRTIYTMPNAYFTEEVTVTPPTGNTSVLKYYHTLDTYLAGGDNGPAFSLPQNLAQSNNTAGNPSVVGVRKDPGGPNDSFVAFAEVQGGREFDNWYSAYYSGGNLYGTTGGGIKGGGNIVNTWNTSPTNDNGLGVQFTLGAITQATTFSYNIAFGGEATLDLDANDSSGATGSAFNAYYVQGSNAVIPVVDTDVSIHNVVGDITQVRATLANALSGDALAVNAANLPAGIHVVSQTASEIVLGVDSTPQTEEQFQLAMQTLGFTTSNTSLASRTINFAVTNELGQEGLASAGTIVMNRAPAIVADDGGSIAWDNSTIHSGNVLGNDSDPDVTNILRVDTATGYSGTSATVAATGTIVAGLYGTLTIHRDGTYDYALDPNNSVVQAMTAGTSLTEDFAYSAIDVVDNNGTDIAQGGSGTAHLTFSLDRPNLPPVFTAAIPDISSVDGATPTTLDISGYVADPEAGPLTFSASGLPPGLTLNPATGIISGLLPHDASHGGVAGDGVYDVTVTASDGVNPPAATHVRYTITNAPPDATDDAATITEDIALLVPANSGLLFNDQGVDGDLLTVTDFTVQGLGIFAAGTTVTIAGAGDLTINSDGSYTFDPAPDYAGTIPAITYAISDGEGGTATAALHLSMTPVADPPVARTDTGVGVEDQNITGNVLANDTDADGDALVVTSFTVGNATPHAAGSTIVIANVGEISLGQDGAFIFAPVANYDGPIPAITYEVSDGTGNSATATLQLSLTPVDDPPSVLQTIPDVATADGASPASLDLNHFIQDPEGAPLTFTASGLPPGLALNPATGIISGTLQHDASQGGIASDGSYDVTVTASDGVRAPVPTVIHYVVSNPAPFAANNHATVTEDTTLVVSAATGLLPNDHDTDGDALNVTHFNVHGLGQFAAGTAALVPGVGVLTINADGSYRFAPKHNYAGPIPAITYTIADGDGATATAALTMGFTSVNDAPVAVHDHATGDEDHAIRGNVLVNDFDSDGETLHVSAVGNAKPGHPLHLSYGTLTINADGTFSFMPNARANALPVGHTVNQSVIYTASDSSGAIATAELTLTISGVNDQPDATVLRDHHHEPGDAVAISTRQAFSDVDSDTLVYSATGLPPGLTIDPKSGVITGRIGPDEGGPRAISVTSIDGHGGKATVTFTLDIAGPAPGFVASPHVPTQTVAPEISVVYGKPVLGSALAGIQDLGGVTTDDPRHETERGVVQSATQAHRNWSGKSTATMPGATRIYSGDTAQLRSADDGHKILAISTVVQDGVIYVGLEKMLKGLEILSTVPANAASEGAITIIDRQHFVVLRQAGTATVDVRIVCRAASGELRSWIVSIDPATGKVKSQRPVEMGQLRSLEPFTAQIATFARRNDAQHARLMQALAGV